jgi:hypothetical protein
MKKIIVILLVLVSICQAATYYVDATDGNDNKDGLSEPNAWQNISKVNSSMSSFAAGDSILFKKGETWIEQLTITCSGNASSNITFDGAGYGSGDDALIDVTGAGTPTACGIFFAGAEYIETKNFRIKGSGGKPAFEIGGGSGDAGSGYTIVVRDVNVLSCDEGTGSGDRDGFSLDDTSQARFYNIAAANCVQIPYTLSHQCITGHANSKYTVDGAVFRNSNMWIANTASVQATITNMTASGALGGGVTVTGNATATHSLIISYSTMNFDSGGGSLSVASGTSPALTFIVQDCNLNFTSSVITYLHGPIQFLRNTWGINDAGFQYYMSNGGVLILTDNNLRFLKSNATTAFYVGGSSSGYINAQRNMFALIGAVGWDFILLRGGTNPNTFCQNIFTGISNCGGALVSVWDDCYSGTFNNNVFYNSSGTTKTALDFSHDGDEAVNAKATCENNIFYDINDVSTQTADKYASIKYNCYYNSENMGGTGSATIQNCIFYNDSALSKPIKLLSGAILNISYSDFYESTDPIELKDSNCVVNWGPGNINLDPCFVQLGVWDFNEPITYYPGDFHLKSQAGRWDPNSETWVMDANTSPCIDAGNPGCPLGDEPNDVNNIRINMGAYGGTAEASKTPAGWRSIADLTNDWVVDINDLGVFVSYWLDSGECIPSDLNRNQSVNFVDYAIFAQQWPGALFAAEPGIEYEISPCNGGLSATEQLDETRFTVTVEGSNIHFEDTMVANCCATDLWLEMEVTDNLITIYEHEFTMFPCHCICDYPVDAHLGPFKHGTYTVEVYEDYGGFIGSTTVTIE